MNTTGQETAHILRDFMIFQKTHTTNLRDVRSLNMWGFGLSNIDIISKLINVETISLSLNNIDTLEPFSHCENLQNLYLRQNAITDLREVDYLSSLPRLSSLMLRDNPISSLPNYRSYILKKLPNLKKLDDIEVSLQERSDSSDYNNDYSQPVQQQNNRDSFSRRKSSPPVQTQNNSNKYKTVNNYHYNNYNDVEYSSEDDSYSNPSNINYNATTEYNDPRRKINTQNRFNNQKNNYVATSNSYKNVNSVPNYNYNYNNNKPIRKNDSNMLTAVLSLLPELNDDSLQVVLEAIQKQRNC
ncbi:DNA damage response, detection of DNA damage [Tritrichomonas musculus]|uniref:DNA damage response, detection of DNA damage n=1 Tax=Tritrichomonas musculus TaxID=1915356 RepID=A0ABR2HUI7_9EUKA